MKTLALLVLVAGCSYDEAALPSMDAGPEARINVTPSLLSGSRVGADASPLPDAGAEALPADAASDPAPCPVSCLARNPSTMMCDYDVCDEPFIKPARCCCAKDANCVERKSQTECC